MTTTSASADIARLHGRINDLDSHLQIPASMWGEWFGEVGAELGEAVLGPSVL